MYELTIPFILILVSTGFIAGIINTMAGGGSNLTIPALMMLGMPADVANATNRIGVLLQCLTAARGFKHHGRLDMSDAWPIVGVTLVGGLFGGLSASYMPPEILKPVLLIAMLSMAAIILIRPGVVAPPEGTPALKISERPASIPILFIAGFYGGFVFYLIEPYSDFCAFNTSAKKTKRRYALISPIGFQYTCTRIKPGNDRLERTRR